MRLVHRAEVTAERRAGDTAHELGAPFDAQDRGLVVGQEIQDVLELLHLHVETRSRRLRGDVLGGARRSRGHPTGGCPRRRRRSPGSAASCSRIPSTVTAWRSFAELLLFGAAEAGTAPTNSTAHIDQYATDGS